MKTAIVTLTVGAAVRWRWRRYAEAGWRAYAKRHNYDLIVIDHPLDDSPRAQARSVSWQKCLTLSIPETAGYDSIVWVDADIIMSSTAPCIVCETPMGKVGAVDEYSTPSRAEYIVALKRKYARWGLDFSLGLSPAAFYRCSGLPETFDRVVQAGVLVLEPSHRKILERVYWEYEDQPGLNFEMRPLSYELLKADAVVFIDSRFNMLWSTVKMLHHADQSWLAAKWNHRRQVREALADCHFLHFAGTAEDMVKV